jgi:hypothetical protein
MSLAAVEPARPEGEAFSARTILALILAGLTAFAGFVVLATYAPELRGRMNGGAHALSSSAVGYRGAVIMLRAMDAPVRVSRRRLTRQELSAVGLVLTPDPFTSGKALRKFPPALRTLIVLPKWLTGPDPTHPGFVSKAGFLRDSMAEALSTLEPGTKVTIEPGFQRPVLRSADGPFAPSTYLPIGRLDGLQTISGPGWRPALVDARGRVVLAISKRDPNIAVLADPDLLNNQGLTDIDTARAGMTILQTLGGEGGVVFDVTLNGLARGRNLGRLVFEPPWLAATLCVLAAALLMGWQALARFGAPAEPGRAIALGAAALVDNSAGLIRMARKESALASAYAETTLSLVARAGGAAAPGLLTADEAEWLARAAERRGLEDPRALAEQAAQARGRDELMAAARKLYRWRLEMAREHS